MMFKAIRKKMLKKALVVLMCLVMLGNLAHGAVLCLGADGRISIEFEADDCCGEVLEIAAVTCDQLMCQEAHLEEPDSCGDCVDIPLSGNCEAKSPTSHVIKKVAEFKVYPAAIFFVPVYDSQNTGSEHFNMMYPPGDIVACLSTVVLTL